MIYVWPPSPLHTLLQCVLNFFAPLVPSLCPYLLLWCRLVFSKGSATAVCRRRARQHSLIHALQQCCAAATASFHARRRHCPGTWKQNFGYKVCSYPHNRFNEILATIWLYSYPYYYYFAIYRVPSNVYFCSVLSELKAATAL